MQKRVAWVTGGTGGIGTAICRSLADAGYQVVAGYSNPEKASAWQQEQKAAGYEIGISYADVTDFESVTKSYQEIQQQFGPVSVLVNNAGITRDGMLKKMTPEQWHAVVSTNLDSVFNTSRACLDGMLEQQYGRIVNISSINGEKGQMGQTNYSAAKAGMHGFTMALAQETARKGITVNTISPGYIATDMIMKIEEKIRDSIRAQIPVGRFGEPEDIARIVVFLADEASSFITGANISANGGQFIHA
ncbi:acetoacetyl-CoA reductase [Marinospirillum alkaliphilum]|uniref:3-oxoacyl-[acyl-carrier-protein] reductase n=1 Tax=Marinospirillum alkaliphilum DSM 21637 TaxID=1122209 RepID=A0A1K1ZTU9_9GAMM|nr:acetoacetyl-CoA reductase [Marinospirillum alkaliphilum]SFX77585.1 3-oxoacyl-[acyl-carrier-protein] reductase [Marinospirillum alkaliphilum DSM 21637]